MASETEAGEERRAWWQELGVGAGFLGVVAVAVVVVVAIVQEWSPEAWSALATWTAAGVALAAGAVALGHLGEARRLRVEQAQPYAVAFMETSAAEPNDIVDLVVRNFGTTAAHDVRLQIEPAPKRNVEKPDVWLPECIPVLAPGQEWRTLWDFAHKRLGSGLPDQHVATVAFSDSQGRPLSCRSVLDWAAYKGRLQVRVYGAHHAAKVLREISTTIRQWTESEATRGLKVFGRDGDAKDEQERERIEARTARGAAGSADRPEESE